MASINGQLRRAIQLSGKSRYRIAKESGVSEATLSRFIHGERDLSIATAERLCKSLGVVLVLRKVKQK